MLIYSEPNKPKLRNIRRNPRVALHFNSDERGDDVVVFTGEARIDRDAPPIDAMPAYVRKYAQLIRRVGQTPESVARTYSVAIRVRLTALRGS